MSANPNEIPRFEVGKDQLDALFTRSNAQAVAERDARRRAAEWPGEIEQIIVAMAKQIRLLNERLATIERRP